MGNPFQIKHLPNWLSLLRVCLAVPFVWGIHDIFVYECGGNGFLLLAFGAIVLSDVADGFLARKFNCATRLGAGLDIFSDALYTLFSLTAFAYFHVIPVWFPFVLVLKLLEFLLTSALLRKARKTESLLFFDRLGKFAVSTVMLLPGIFVFRCVLLDYQTVMNAAVYILTGLLLVSFVSRVCHAVKIKNEGV
jgi:phosphatidylglycerophosphate synthase